GAGRGTGMGLAQLYGFAQQSGGTDRVESQTGTGTRVRLLLPRSRRELAPEAPSVATPTGEHRDDLRVLVVEDEPSVAAVVTDMLEQLGHHGICVATVAAALSA